MPSLQNAEAVHI